MSDFIHLKTGYVVNPDAISHIDLRKPKVAVIHVGPNNITVEGDDVAMLHQRYVPAPQAAPVPKAAPPAPATK